MPAQNPYFGVVFGMQTAIAPWPSQGSFAQSGIIWHSISIAKMPNGDPVGVAVGHASRRHELI